MKDKTRRLIERSHKRAKKRISFLVQHPFLLPVAIFFVVVFFGLSLLVTTSATTVGANDKRIVELYIDGEEQVVTTRSKTVKDLLSKLEIELIPEDIVEPEIDSPIEFDQTQVNVYRARPVAVIDGDRIITILSANRSARLVAVDAGLKLFPEDEVELVQDPHEDSLTVEPAEKLIIRRSKEIQLNIYGSVNKVRTLAKTVQEYLDMNNIVPKEGSTLQPSDTSTAITEGMLIGVNNFGIKTESIEEEIAFEIEKTEDPNMQVGQSRTERAGVVGRRSVIYEITEKDGAEISRQILQTIVLQEPIAEIRYVGKKPATLSPNINLSGEKVSIMAGAGIAESDYPYVDFIISHESGWRPGASNSSSGAYGLCQALPGSKMASAGSDYLTNPSTQLRWCSGYANGRYGGWQGAYNAWLAQSWW